MTHPWLAAVRADLAAAGDPERAAGQQAYMKSAMPYHGVPTPEQRRLVREVVTQLGPPADRDAWLATVTELWDGARFREERYVAVDLCRHRSARPWQDAAAVPLYDHFVVTGAWWDHVDEIASRLVGPALPADPAAVTPVLRTWARASDRWLRRTAVICQLGAKHGTDLALLTEAIEANLDDSDFFLRKGIGWALRQYARTDPEWVRTFVVAHPALSPLSRKEALKHL